MTRLKANINLLLKKLDAWVWLPTTTCPVRNLWSADPVRLLFIEPLYFVYKVYNIPHPYGIFCFGITLSVICFDLAFRVTFLMLSLHTSIFYREIKTGLASNWDFAFSFHNYHLCWFPLLPLVDRVDDYELRHNMVYLFIPKLLLSIFCKSVPPRMTYDRQNVCPHTAYILVGRGSQLTNQKIRCSYTARIIKI